jgi:hypothetical protein
MFPNLRGGVSNINPGTEAASTDLLDEVPYSPITPVTPVTSEGLTSLHDLIIKDTAVLNRTSKDRLQKRMHKLASAAKVSFVEQALLKDRNQFLLEINREAKARWSIKILVLGKAKVMSFEDLEEARAKRAAKGQASAGKSKRGRKRKSRRAGGVDGLAIAKVQGSATERCA